MNLGFNRAATGFSTKRAAPAGINLVATWDQLAFRDILKSHPFTAITSEEKETWDFDISSILINEIEDHPLLWQIYKKSSKSYPMPAFFWVILQRYSIAKSWRLRRSWECCWRWWRWWRRRGGMCRRRWRRLGVDRKLLVTQCNTLLPPFFQLVPEKVDFCHRRKLSFVFE